MQTLFLHREKAIMLEIIIGKKKIKYFQINTLEAEQPVIMQIGMLCGSVMQTTDNGISHLPNYQNILKQHYIALMQLSCNMICNSYQPHSLHVILN